MPWPLRGPNRRAPWPWDMTMTGITGVTGTVGFLLGKRDKDAPLVATVPQDAAPEEEASWTDWSKGYGLRIQTGEAGKYYYALGVDASIQNMLQLGPSVTTVTPDSSLDTTNGISHFFEIGGAIYALNGRYALKRSADTAAGWGSGSTIKDFGSGNVATDVLVFTPNSGSTTYAFVALGDGAGDYFHYFDGSNWAQHASLQALCFASNGRELFRAHDTNLVAKCDSNTDPLTAGNWSTQWRIGDKSSAITRMVTTSSGHLVIFKTDGVYVLDDEGQDVPLYSDLKLVPDATNGKYTFQYEDYRHVTLNGRHFRIAPDFTIEGIGPERFAENDSPVKGYITAGAGTPFAAYAGIYNPDSQNSYLMKFGAWDLGGTRPEKIDAWHGSITQAFSTKIITAMKMSTVGAATRHSRLYLGFSDGTVGWFTLPCVPNPSACSSYSTPNTSANYLFLPAWHGGMPQVEKHLRMFTLNATGISSAPSVDVGTAAIGDTTSATFTEVAFTAAPGGQAEVATDTQYSMTDIRIELKGSGGTVFKVLGLALRYASQPPPGFVYRFSVICEDGLIKRDGVGSKYGVDHIRSVIRSALTSKGSVTVQFPGETSTKELTIVDYGEGTAWDAWSGTWRASLDISAITSARLTALTGASTASLT